jgi:hypothetical protein
VTYPRQLNITFNFLHAANAPLCVGAASLNNAQPNLFETTVHAVDVFLVGTQNYSVSGTTLAAHLSHSR